MRAPVAPSGWPMEMPPPSMLTFSIGMPSSRIEATACDAEGFVDLDHVDVLDGEAGAGERFQRGGHRAHAHDFRRHAGDGDRADAAENVEAAGLRVGFRGDQRGGGAVGERRGCAGRDRAVGAEGGLEAGEAFERGLRAQRAVLYRRCRRRFSPATISSFRRPARCASAAFICET